MFSEADADFEVVMLSGIMVGVLGPSRVQCATAQSSWLVLFLRLLNCTF